jgi:hypothetical protein
MGNTNFEEKIKELEELQDKFKNFENNVRYEYEYNPQIKTKFELKEELDKVYKNFINVDLKKFEDLKKEHEKLQYTLKDSKSENEEQKDKVESLFISIKNWENNIEVILGRYKNILRDNEINFALEEIKQFEKQKEQINNILDKYDDYNKKILEIMGIFLTIFSIIGLGVSSILNLESNHIATWLMICGTILITMSGLFYLVNPNRFKNDKYEIEEVCKWLFNTLKKPMIIGFILLLMGGCIRYVFPEKKTKLELLEKDVENLSKNLDTKDLKIEIEKLKSKIEELENSKSKDKK